MTTVLVAYLIGAVIWGGVSYGLLGGFWFRSANSTRLAVAILCGVIWFPSFVYSIYCEVRGV